jgi:hypothetical protein
MAISYIFPVLVFWSKKNLATLALSKITFKNDQQEQLH